MDHVFALQAETFPDPVNERLDPQYHAGLKAAIRVLTKVWLFVEVKPNPVPNE